MGKIREMADVYSPSIEIIGFDPLTHPQMMINHQI
jgi:hypothetical protein